MKKSDTNKNQYIQTDNPLQGISSANPVPDLVNDSRHGRLELIKASSVFIPPIQDDDNPGQ